MAQTFAEIIDACELLLQDKTNVIFSAADDLNPLLPRCMREISKYSSYEPIFTGTLAASKIYTLPTDLLHELIDLPMYCEYEVDQDPIEYRNLKKRSYNTVVIDVSTTPTVGDSIYLFPKKKHVLNNEPGTDDLAGDVQTTTAKDISILPVHALGSGTIYADSTIMIAMTGAVNATTAAGLSSLAVKSLYTGTIKKNSTFVIAGDATTYTVTADATISGNVATLAFTPVLAAQATLDAVVTITTPSFTITADAVIAGNAATLYIAPPLSTQATAGDIVTLTLSTSTLTSVLEDILINLVSGRAAISKSFLLIQKSHVAITTIATAATAISKLDSMIVRAVNDVNLGRTAVTKIDGLITTADTEIDKVGAQITLSISDVDLGRTAVTKISPLLTKAQVDLNKIIDEINQAITDLDYARTLDPTIVQIANGSMNYVRLSQAGLSNAREIIEETNGYINQGRAEEALASINRLVASGSLANARAYLEEANGFFAEVRANENLANADRMIAAGELSSATARLHEAGGSFQKAGFELRISQASDKMRDFGERLVAQALHDLRGLQKPKQTVPSYPSG